MKPARIYLDYNATTPLDPAVRAIFLEALNSSWANPSSIHQPGRQARARLDEARERVAGWLKCRPSEITFTSGGTEANNLAILGTARALAPRRRHLICSSIEHHAVLQCHRHLARNEGFSLAELPVDSTGRVDPADLQRCLRPDTALVSVMAANNETGVIQPVAELATLCRNAGVTFHVDAVQWFGKQPFGGVEEWGADLVSACGHKLHGPKGVGLLYCRSPLPLAPVFQGGSQENDRRPGTENLPAIVAFSEALPRLGDPPVFECVPLREWTGRLATLLRGLEGVTLAGSSAPRLGNTVAFTVNGTDSLTLLANLDLAGVSASSGSACSAGSLEPSHVLQAMGYPVSLASSLVRLSLGRENTESEIDSVSSLLPGIIERSRLG